MANIPPIQFKRSNTACDIPTANDLITGELSINLADSILYTKDSDGIIKPLSGGSGSPIQQVQVGTVITAVTTNPTKGTIWQDNITFNQVGDFVQCFYHFYQNVGGTSGSGDYLWQLPTGHEFHANHLRSQGVGTDRVGAIVRAMGHVRIINGANNFHAEGVIVPYSNTQFRIYTDYANGTNHSQYINASHFGLDQTVAYFIEFNYYRP